MSDKQPKEAKAKKGGGGMMVKVGGALALLAAGGGAVFGLVQAGVIGGGHAEAKEDNNPKFVRKGEEDPFAPKVEAKEGEGAVEVDGDGGSEFRTVYFTFGEEFTSNLKDSDALVQTALACSTRRDGRVVMWLKKHELAIRSAILTVLADTPEDDVYSMPGKERLQKRLTAAINKVLVDNEGFGGVDQVYFRNFIIQ
jgi:flagellar FliL protein